MRLDAKIAKTNADNAQLFAESVERHFGIQNNNFDSNHFDEVNQFIEDNYEYFYPPEDLDDYRSDMDDDHHLVADIDSDTLIKIVKFLKRGKAPGPDNIVRKINVCKIEVHYARNVGLAFQEYFGLVCKAKIVSREFVSRALNY